MLIRMFGRLAGAAAVVAAAIGAASANEPIEVVSPYAQPVFTEASLPGGETDGVASVRMVGLCRDNCGPQGVAPCGPNGMCRDGSCLRGGPQGAYLNGGCPNACRHPGPSAECYAGRPYTLGDLGSDLGWCKSRCDDVNPLSCQNLGHCYQGSSLQQWWCDEKMKYHCNRAYRNQVWGAHLHNKFNYFVPSGNGGKGVPPFGCYQRIIATQPGYYDARDSQVYASPMTGVPTAVPLAPNVRYQYNYGWGTPSSRLTPISTIVPPRF